MDQEVVRIEGENESLDSKLRINSENERRESTMNQSAKIRKLASNGKTNSEISKQLGVRYQTVWRTLHRKFQNQVPQEVLESTGVRKREIPIVSE